MSGKVSKLVLGFTAGLLSGSFIRLGFEIIDARPISVGGEVLILPLIALLLYFGYSLGRDKFHSAYMRGYYAGYKRGMEDEFNIQIMHPNCRCSITRQ